MKAFKAEIKIIGVNPYVSVPEKILKKIFKEAKKDKGPIPIKGIVNSLPYKQTLMKFKGEWRLYINMSMLKNSPKRIGEIIDISVEYDPVKRTISPHPLLAKALQENEKAKTIFDTLRPSAQLEIIRYIANLKTEESISHNVSRAISYLLGKGRFVGRDKP